AEQQLRSPGVFISRCMFLLPAAESGGCAAIQWPVAPARTSNMQPASIGQAPSDGGSGARCAGRNGSADRTTVLATTEWLPSDRCARAKLHQPSSTRRSEELQEGMPLALTRTEANVAHSSAGIRWDAFRHTG